MTSPRISQAMVRGMTPLKAFLVQMLVAPLIIVLGLPAYLFMLDKERSAATIAKILPGLMKNVDKSFRKVKAELTAEISGGRVLDVGAGAGGWIAYLANADEIVELEPNANLNPALKAAVRSFMNGTNPKPRVKNVDIVNKFVGDLPLNEPFDYVVLGNVLCEVPDQLAVLRDVEARLKPGGRVIFLEHVVEDGWRGMLQRSFNWWWSVASDGCNCDRRTLKSIQRVFGEKNVESYSLFNFAPIPFIHKFVAGVATKTSGTSSSKM